MYAAVPYGLVVRIRRSHRRGPGSIPGVGTRFFLETSTAECFFFFFFFLWRDTRGRSTEKRLHKHAAKEWLLEQFFSTPLVTLYFAVCQQGGGGGGVVTQAHVAKCTVSGKRKKNILLFRFSKKSEFPHRESNPDRGGESAES